MTAQHSRLLFLCTGNYYRSRFAELLFNHHAAEGNLPWRAFSRGLAIEMVGKDAGLISPATTYALNMKGIPLNGEIRAPIALAEQDLTSASHVVALKHAEHYPLMSSKFPHWADRIEYWHVHDIDVESPVLALPQIEKAVICLLDRFGRQFKK